MMDLRPLLASHKKVSATRRRFAASTINTFGETVNGAYTDTVRQVVIVPAGRRTLERLPASVDRTRFFVVVYDDEEIRDASASGRADQWLHEGRWFEIVDVGPYLGLGKITFGAAQLIDKRQEFAP